MRTRRRATITDLRRAIDGLPRDTRVAMLDGIRSNDIIVGAYTGADGICPMLAAHRRGAKTSHIAFAKAWDMFAFGGARDRAARRATRRELLVLSAHLEASLLEEDAVPGLAEAIAEHRALAGLRDPGGLGRDPGGLGRDPGALGRDPGALSRDPGALSRELRRREDRSWPWIVRRRGDYDRALARLEHEHARAQDAAPARR